jgi:hypothetical protein
MPVAENADAWHTLPAAEVSRRIHTEPEHGLSGGEAGRRLLRHGPNALGEKPARSLLAIVGVCSLAPVAVVEVVKLLRSPRRGEG